MRTTKNQKEHLLELRKKAEKKLSDISTLSKKLTADEIEHELNVHKVELEMQNEALRFTQQKLEKSTQDFTELFELAPIGYFILDRNAVIENLNNIGSRLLGMYKPQLIKKNFSSFLSSEICQDNFYRHRNLVFETETVQQIESKIRRKDGIIFPALIVSTLVKDEQQQFKHFLMMVSDISERKEQERLVSLALDNEKKLNELKSRFINTASHEFRTPLAIILLSTEILETYTSFEDEEKRKKHFYKIKSAVQGLTEILMDFLSLDKFENGLMLSRPEPLNIVRFMENIIEEINIKQQPLVYNHIGDNEMVNVDSRMLKVCLVNIIGNAIKYSYKEGLVTIISETNEKKEIKISVKDEGIGIADSDKPFIFDQFYRAKNAEIFQGTGLGLNIVQKFVAIMEGSISFTSKINVGSTFVLTFPNK